VLHICDEGGRASINIFSAFHSRHERPFYVETCSERRTSCNKNANMSVIDMAQFGNNLAMSDAKKVSFLIKLKSVLCARHFLPRDKLEFISFIPRTCRLVRFSP
jgi:hypothetical protein